MLLHCQANPLLLDKSLCLDTHSKSPLKPFIIVDKAAETMLVHKSWCPKAVTARVTSDQHLQFFSFPTRSLAEAKGNR